MIAHERVSIMKRFRRKHRMLLPAGADVSRLQTYLYVSSFSPPTLSPSGSLFANATLPHHSATSPPFSITQTSSKSRHWSIPPPGAGRTSTKKPKLSGKTGAPARKPPGWDPNQHLCLSPDPIGKSLRCELQERRKKIKMPLLQPQLARGRR